MSDYNITNHPFRPVRCSEEVLKTLTPIEGQVVFTTDTRKIFACFNNEYKMLGGSSGVFYGERTLTDDELYGDEIFFTFLPEQIDGDNLPAVDDLILNIPDGGFYRVLDVSEDEISTQRIAISGGGGGTGGGGGSTSTQGSLDIIYVTPQNSSTITGVDYYIEYEIVAKDSAGDPIIDAGTATWKINGKEYIQTVYNGPNSFKVDEYLDASLATNKISLVVNMNTGGYDNSIKSKTWNVKAVDLTLDWEWNYALNSYVSTDTFTLQWVPSGGINCTTYISFYDKFGIKVKEYSQDTLAKNTGKEVYSEPIEKLDYGSYTCEMYLSAIVNGETYSTESIKHEITFISGGTSTILTVPFYKNVATQYDTLNIPFMVYDPDVDTCNVSFYVNDIRVGGDSYDRGLHYWPYTLSEYGTVKLTIKSDNDEASKDFEMFVNELDLDASEPSGAVFSLKASKFSSNDELRNWKSNTAENVTLEFSENFDWENGGLQFEEKPGGIIEKFIRVRQGTRMTVKYKLFGRPLSNNGKNFKINFRATNCYDYSAPLLSCYDADSKLGIRLEAQQAIFSSDSFPSFATQYFENSYIELETEIWPDVPDKDPNNNLYGDRFIMFWIDGIPAGVKAYARGENFQHLSGKEKEIVVGSDLCDVDIYVMKAYERKLTENEHLDNFIMDAPSTQEMLARYQRNDILDNAGEISYTRLVEKNPECHIYMYEMDHMTTSKNDKVDDCIYTELFREYNTLDNPHYKAEGAQVYVQGTSSAAYGAAAFNLRTKFKKGLTDKDGNQVDGWKVTETAMPIELPCTKVNVASCENVNNVVNQEWYNRFQPYHDAHRRKNDGNVYRDTMQFESGVIFVKDNNKVDSYLGTGSVEDKTSSYLAANCFLDTKDYVKKPYYKMYAIGNMGNDKKNVEVFHDVDNPKACCVEVADNQNAEHWMTVTVGMEQFDLKKPFHEFRYPDGNEEASIEQKQAWIDFVDWMAKSDPSPYDPNQHPYGYTGAELPEPVTYGPYTFRGFDPPGYEGKPNPSGISIKGLKVEQYANTYTHDTREYRIAKMLNECEDHLVMDSIVYHYLFIQRHTMVDNVAKNTFWSSEDLIHWDLTKDYDNDTSDGNNNSGYLTFTYGIENLDKDSEGADIFNASDSVWIQFIHGLPTVQEDMYKQLALKGAWNALDYLAECTRHQVIIPERCWIYDYFRKYIRPRRLGLDENTFLNRLEGGKKTHQRRQYENYQEYYLNSKYLAGTAFTDSASVDMRLNKKPSVDYIQCTVDSIFSKAEIYYIKNENDEYEQVQNLKEEDFNANKTNYFILEGSWDPNNALTVSFYTDCYPSIHIGGQIHRSAERLKRGQTYDLPVGTMIQSANDSTCYLYGAAMLQSLTGLASTYPSYVKLANAGKLRNIAYGSDEAGYSNPNLTSLDIGSNHMLQVAQAQNSGQASGIGSTDLSEATQLKELLINGSTLKTLILPEGGIVDTLKLNALNRISMSDLTLLNTIELDEDIYDPEKGINNLTVKNCPAMDPYTYRMALTAPMTNYAFTGFNWIITSTDDLEIVEGKVTGIKVVDKLMTRLANNGNHAASLVGTILIDVNCNIDEYDMYEKYCETYPNLIIEYSDKVTGLNPAVELRFMTSNAETAEIHYRVLGNGDSDGDSIGKLISDEGPVGFEITDPNKEPTAKFTYTFTGYWTTNSDASIIPHGQTYSNNITYYYKDGLLGAMDRAINFNSVVPTQDYLFYPVYQEILRKHTVTFYDLDKNVIKSVDVPYDETCVSQDNTITNYHYLDSSNLLDYQRYGFQGWTTVLYEPGKGKNMTYYDINTYKIEGPINFFPYFEIEDCRKVPTNPDYFAIDNNGSIYLKDEYKLVLAGKVTIPNLEGATSVKLFNVNYQLNGNKGITHIYFLDGSTQYKTIGSYGFTGCIGLKKFTMPESITSIETQAFQGCINLEEINLHDNITAIGESAFKPSLGNAMKLKLTTLPTKLTTLGASAFYGSGSGIELTSLPSGLTILGSYTFYNCPNVKIDSFGNVDNSKAPGITNIGANCFANAGNGPVGSVTSITFGSNVKSIGNNAFLNYATNSLGEVIFTSLTQEAAEAAASSAGFSEVTIVGSYTG